MGDISNRKRFSGAAAVWVAVLLLSACGKPWDAEMAGGEVAPLVPAGGLSDPAFGASDEDFSFVLLAPAADSAVPCSGENCLKASFTTQHTPGEISIRETLAFDQPLFFVWPEKAYQSSIVSASFGHRVQDPANRFEGTVDRNAASFDSAQRVWFIPTSKLGRAMDHDPATQQWLFLDLLLGNGERREITIRFRARGSLPKITPRLIRSEAPSSPALLAMELRDGNHLVRSELISNPAKRPLRLWIRTSFGGLKADVVHTHYRFHERRNGPPVGPVPEHHSASVSLVPERLVINGQGKTEAVALISDGWFWWDIGPGDEIRLDWFAIPAVTASLGVPAPSTRVISWETRTPVKCAPRGECFGGDEEIHRQSITETWAITKVSLSGAWQRELRISDSNVQVGEAIRASGPRAAVLVEKRDLSY